MNRVDVTKPHLSQKFEIVDLNQKLFNGGVPPMNKQGFWKKPEFHKEFPPPHDDKRLRNKARV